MRCRSYEKYIQDEDAKFKRDKSLLEQKLTSMKARKAVLERMRQDFHKKCGLGGPLSRATPEDLAMALPRAPTH